MPRPVLTKQDFVRRYKQGEFGNRAPTWENVDDFMWKWDEFKERRGLYHLRSKNPGGIGWYNLEWEDVGVKIWLAVEGLHLPRSDFYVSEMAPHAEHGTFQGELWIGLKGLHLEYYLGHLPMRDAMKQWSNRGWILEGLSAKGFIQRCMDPWSYEWVQQLLTDYPGHIIEFSCFDCYWGTVPRRNTVIWEVRNY